MGRISCASSGSSAWTCHARTGQAARRRTLIPTAGPLGPDRVGAGALAAGW